MQNITNTHAIAKHTSYSNSIVRKGAMQKITLFIAILTCLVIAVNI